MYLSTMMVTRNRCGEVSMKSLTEWGEIEPRISEQSSARNAGELPRAEPANHHGDRFRKSRIISLMASK